MAETQIKKTKLSKQEYRVALLIADGIRNKDIANLLKINEKTISTYIRRMYTKLNLSKDINSYGLVIMLQIEGLIPLKSPTLLEKEDGTYYFKITKLN